MTSGIPPITATMAKTMTAVAPPERLEFFPVLSATDGSNETYCALQKFLKVYVK